MKNIQQTDPCVTATGGINFVRLCSIEICPLVNIGFFPRSHEYEYPISLHGRPRDNTDGESATSLKQEYVPNIRQSRLHRQKLVCVLMCFSFGVREK